VAIAAETRTQSNHGTGPLEAIEDARDLIRWLRHNAETFNIDPNKIVIGGAAGGALLGLMTSMPKSKHLPSVDGLDCHAQALIFFSALVDPVKNAQAISKFPSSSAAKQYSPARHIRRKLPPMLFFHGKSDRVTPFSDIERFCRRARFWGNRCQLIDFERADHSFFNFNVSHKNFELTIATADHFLVELGLLQPDETLGQD
jgi:acetyl esterase/lipase